MAFDISAVEGEIRSEFEASVKERVVNRLNEEKEKAFARIEQAKLDIAAIDAELASRQGPEETQG